MLPCSEVGSLEISVPTTYELPQEVVQSLWLGTYSYMAIFY